MMINYGLVVISRGDIDSHELISKSELLSKLSVRLFHF